MSTVRERRGGTRLSDPLLGSRDSGPFHDHPSIGMLHLGGRYMEFIFLRRGDFDTTNDWTSTTTGGGSNGTTFAPSGGGLLIMNGTPGAGVGLQHQFLGGGNVRPVAVRNASSWGFGAFFGVDPAQVTPVHFFIGFFNNPGTAILTAAGDLNAALNNYVGFWFKAGTHTLGRPHFVAKGNGGSTQDFSYTLGAPTNTEIVGGWWGFRLDTNDTVSAYRLLSVDKAVDELQPITTIVKPTRLTTPMSTSLDLTLVFAVMHTVGAGSTNYFGIWDGCITRGTFVRTI